MKIDIESVITEAKGLLGLENTTKWDAWLEKKINQGALHLNNLDTYAISCGTFDVECTKIHIPQATEIIAIKNTISTECCTGLCQVIADENSVDGRFMQCGCNGTYFIADRNVLTNFNGNGCFGGNVFSFENGYINLPSNSTLTEAKVWYRGYNEDEDGIMVIDELQERGLAAYAAFKFASSGTHFSKYDRMQIVEWKKDWVSQKSFLGGKAQQNDFRQNKGKFAAIARAILIDPYQALNINL
jgi:hypothetical protein